ncbi:hypothetical protein [Polaromonas sp. CG_9.11]|uniref:hypothetical protein n=1 Tax=Polaromonas sp. CG_9.11 TaxID=2787730 RepID=UPI0018CBD6E1|nr:hypothetical protein [Polaromonas sp. CG_9.11]MBG6077770.1 hypothetical protein [Polaromonas sp. CG_9.11]
MNMLCFFPWFFKNGLCLKKILKFQKPKTVLFTMSQAPGQVKSSWLERTNAANFGWVCGGGCGGLAFGDHTLLQHVATGVSG